jgi:hypothetical protein
LLVCLDSPTFGSKINFTGSGWQRSQLIGIYPAKVMDCW